MTIRPTELHSEFRTLANRSATITDTWTLTKLTRVFCRVFDDEFESLTPDARLRGREVHSFLTGMFSLSSGMRHPRSRADAVRAIDAFSEARRTQ